ncbi:DNA primase, phage associated, partial [hydrothermal vent metagenome]
GPVVKKGEALSNEAYQSALELLKDEKLLDRILEDFNACGVVGENTNKLVGYLACVSRKLDKPLAVMIQSSSAAGKSALMDAILNFIPEEERVQYSAMTGQSLYYMGDMDLKNKILAISEEEGAQNASYALKLLQSEGEVSIASTGKDETTGDMVTKTYIVKGPVMLFLTTTAINLDEELLNRCLVLSVDESREQTKAIHDIQRKQQMLEGLFADSNKMYLTALHRNAQRILQPVDVVNPYADQLTFLDDKTRTRRDHIKYLHLINSITFLHQYQRETRTAQRRGETYRFIEVAIKDIEVANDLANEILGQTLDELPPQTRKMLDYIYQMVKVACEKEGIERSQYRFTRKTVRHYVGWTDFQVKTHMKKLEEMEYVLVHKGGRGQSFVYELLYNDEGKDNEKFLMGLIDVKDIKRNYDANKEHRKTNKEPSRSIQRAPKEHRSSIVKNSVNTTDTVLNEKTGEKDEKHISIGNIKVSSCRSDISETEA